MWLIVAVLTVLAVVFLFAVILAVAIKYFGGDRYKYDRGYEGYGNNAFKGELGEWKVEYVLKSVAGGSGKVLNNYMFMGEQRSVQVDHILINEYGIFVIETKNYSGRIYGSGKQSEWTQVLAKGNVKEKFRNPLKQNAGHIYNLRKLLDKDIPVFGIVVFVQNNTQYIEAENVVGLQELETEIAKHCIKKVLPDERIEEIYQTLIEKRKNEEISDLRHIDEINIMLQGVNTNTVCPRCGGKLKERTKNNRKFIGCSNFPRCRFTKSL